MATVAPAVADQSSAATARTVDESLWWDSFVLLFNEMENAHLSTDLPPSLVNKLKSNHAWFLDSVSMFKSPNQTSKSALEASQIAVGSHQLVVRSELREAALEVSSCLCLDEVQSYILVNRTVVQNNILVDFKVQKFLHLVLLQYCLERQCLLKCIRQILVHGLYVIHESHVSDVIREEALQLVSDEVERKLSSVLKDLVSCEPLEHMGVDLATLWVEEALVEVNLVLDILFLAYYETLCTCKCEQWISLCSLFKEILSNLSIGKLAISIEARNSLYQAKVQLLLILIETLDLDNLLSLVHDGVPFRQGDFVFSLVDVQEMDAIVSSFNILETMEAGPLVLAWAVLLCLISSLPEKPESYVLMDIDHVGYVRQAFEAAPLRYLIEILDSSILRVSDTPFTGYLSVMRTLVSAFIASFEISHQLEDNTFNQIVDVLCKIYRGEESLCVQFWDRDSFVDSPIRSLLCSLEEEFPFRILELVRLLSAFCEGTWPAECVYNFLDKMVGVTCLFEIPGASMLENDQIVETSLPLNFPGVDGLFIPSQTRGHVLKVVDGNVALVRWEYMQSGIYVLLLRLTLEFQWNSYEEVFVILDLLCRLLSFNKGLCFALMNIENSIAVKAARINGHLENTMCVDVVRIICTLVSNLAPTVSSVGVMSMCISILSKMLKCSPSHVVEVSLRINILDLNTCGSSSGMWLLSGGLAKMLVVDCEQSEDCCSLTASVLDFTMQLVDAGVEGDMVSSLVVFSLQFILVNHEQWKYKLRHARWKVTLKVLELVKVCIKSIQDSQKLGSLVRDILLSDSSIHNTLFQLMCTTTPALERLFISRQYELKEIEGLQLGVCSALDIVCSLLSDLTKDPLPGVSVFHQAVLSSTTKPIPVAKAVMSLISFFRNPEVQVAAAKVLSLLCILVEKAQPNSLGSISLVSDEVQIRDLSSSIHEILYEETAVSEDLYVAILRLLTSAALYQPAFLLAIVFSENDVTANNGSNVKQQRVEPPLGSLRCREASLIDSLLQYLKKSEDLIKSHSFLLLNVLNFLKALWQGASQYPELLERLKTSNKFWKNLSSIMAIATEEIASSSKFLKGDKTLYLAYTYECQAAVLEIIAHEIFLQKKMVQDKLLEKKTTEPSERKIVGAVGTDKSKSAILLDLESVLSSWFEDSVMNDLIMLYASCGYDNGIVFQAKMAASLCIIHVVEKLSVGDFGSLSLSILEKIHKISKKLSEQPAFTDLVAEYSLRGYSEGNEINALILSDLYYHLQGELEGREITASPFKELSQYLLQLQAFRTKKGKYMDLFRPDSYAYLFDPNHLKKSLGLECWDHSKWKASKEIAERMLIHMHDANLMVFNMVSKFSALKALTAILSVYIGNVSEAKPTSLGGRIRIELMESCIDHLCKCIQTTAESFVPAQDLHEEILNFLATQAELLLNLMNFVYMQARSNGVPRCLPTCMSIIKTAGSCLRVLTDARPSIAGISETLKLFLILHLKSLQFAYPKSDLHEKSELVASGVFSDISLTGLGLLPILCNCVVIPELCNLSLSVIDCTLKGFLTTNSWLPILQKHLRVQHIIPKLQQKDSFISISVLLKFLLTLARTRGGAEMLQIANIFSSLKGLFSLLLDENPLDNLAESGLSVALNKEEKAENIWGLGLAIVTAMIYSLGEDSSVGMVESAIPYFFVEKAYLMSYYLSAPNFPTDDHSKKRTRTQKTQTSLMALVETEQTLMLICTLAKYQHPWNKYMKEMDSQLRERSIHLLAFISRGGQQIGEGSHRAASLLCSPVLKEEVESSGMTPYVDSRHGWFALSALGCERRTSISMVTNTALVGPTMDRANENTDLTHRTYFSDSVAVQIYRIAFLLLKFLCMQAINATTRAEEVGFVDLAHFPELPMPEILHGLQDQAVAIVTELCKSDKPKVIETEIQDICSLLVQIMEKALYLELCVSQICGIRPVLGRVDDFLKEIKPFIQVAEEHTFMAASLKSLKQIIALVYPGLLQTEGIRTTSWLVDRRKLGAKPSQGGSQVSHTCLDVNPSSRVWLFEPEPS